MLRPTALNTTDYSVALKPTLGFEKELWVSQADPQGGLDLGNIVIATTNSGIVTRNQAANVALLSSPSELIAMLDTELDNNGTTGDGGQEFAITLIGTDQNDAVLTATATISVPTYSQDQLRKFPKNFSAEIIPTVDGKKFKTWGGVSAIVANAKATNARVRILAVPSLSTFIKVGTRTQLDYDLRIRPPHAVQDGADEGAYIKPGTIPVGSASFSTKVPNYADGAARLNGKRVCALVKERKEDKLITGHHFITGFIATVKPSAPEGADPVMLSGTAMYEQVAIILPS